MAHHKKILISVSDSLLEEVDLLAQRQNVKRAEMMKKGYEDMAKINLEFASVCFEADCQQQQSYEEKLSECE